MVVKGSTKTFDFKDFVENKDYVGALAILESGQCDCISIFDKLLWIAFCSFRLGDYSRSKEVYLDLLSGKHGEVPKGLGLYLAITHFYESSYPEAEKAALSVPGDFEVKNRILLQIARVTDDETKVAKYRLHLRDTKQDELSVAAIELYRHHYKETADIYEKMIAEDSDDLALNVYLAVCYYKMVRCLVTLMLN
jgi:intraflagellar transport protein 56